MLNEDFSFFDQGSGSSVVSEEACNENVIGDTDVGVMFVSKHKSLQMTTMRWPLSQSLRETSVASFILARLRSEERLLMMSKAT